MALLHVLTPSVVRHGYGIVLLFLINLLLKETRERKSHLYVLVLGTLLDLLIVQIQLGSLAPSAHTATTVAHTLFSGKSALS